MQADGTYAYTVTALDGAGNESRRSRSAAVTFDAKAPDAPKLARAKSPTSVAPLLSWRRDAGVDHYRIRRDGLIIGQTRLSLLRDELVADDGTHTYELIAVDAAGNESAESQEAEVELDTKPPEAPDLSAPSPTNVPELQWREIEGAVLYLVLRDGEVVEKTSKLGYRDEGLPEGTYAYRVEAVDEAGNVSDKLGGIEVVVDTTPPAAPRVRAATATSGAPTLSWRTGDDAIRYEIDRGEKRDVVETTELSYTDKEAEREGEYSYRVTAIDAAGNRSEPSKTIRVVVDRAVLDAPADLTADESPTKESPSLHWSPVEAAEQYIVLRDGSETGRSGKPDFVDQEVSEPGRYAYTVQAVNAAGNASPPSQPVVVLFRLSGEAPETPAEPATDAPVTNRPSITWKPVPNAAAYAVARDGVEIGRVKDTAFTDEDLREEGKYQYSVAAIGADDSLGEFGPSLTVIVDLTAPETTFTETPDRLVRDAARIAFESDDAGAVFRCLVDDGDIEECTSPLDLEKLDTGDHTVYVQAVDVAGNRDESPAKTGFSSDATPPATPVLSAQADTDVKLGSQSGAVLLHADGASDVTRIVVTRDGATVLDAPSGSETRDADLRDGTRYAYEAIAYDEAQNASEPATVSVETPDRTAPSPPGSLAGAGYPPVVTWNPDPGTTFTLARAGERIARQAENAFTDADARDTEAPSAPDGLEVTGRGTDTVSVSWRPATDAGTTYAYTLRGEDAEGNQGDESAPVDVVATSGVALYRVTVDGTDVPDVDGVAIDLTGLRADRRHLIVVRSVDGAGNVSPASEVLSVGTDAILARPSDLAVAASPTRTSPAFTWTAVADAVGYVVRRDGVVVGRPTTEAAFADAALTTDGEASYTVTAVDDLGVESPAAGPITIVYDTTAPETVITAPPPSPSRSDATTEFSADDAGASFVCGLDESAPVACVSPWILHDLATGAHRITVTATDAAGNTDPTPATAELRVDHSAPASPTLEAAAVATPLSSSQGRVTVTAAPGTGSTRVVVVRGDHAVIDGAGTTITDEVADGTEITYTAVTYDEAGNASAEVTVSVRTPDRTPPDAPSIAPAAGYPVRLAIRAEDGAVIALRRNGDDAGADVGTSVTDTAATDRAAPEAPAGLRTTTASTDGFDIAWSAVPDVASPYQYRARATDVAGNASGWGEIAAADARSGVASYTVIVDGTAVATTTRTEAHLTDVPEDGAPHTVTITATDAAGNRSPGSRELVLQGAHQAGAPPLAISVTSRPAIAAPGARIELAARAIGTGPRIDDVRWTFDDGGTARGATVHHVWKTGGSHLAIASATAANGSTATVRQTVLLDGDAPRVRIAGVGHGQLRIEASDRGSGLAAVDATIDGRTSHLGPVASSRVPIAPGRHRITVTARDAAGNRATVRATLVVRSGAPRIVVTGPAAAARTAATITIRAKAGASPIAKVSVDGRSIGRATRVVVSTGPAHLVTATAADGATTRVVVRIDRLEQLHLIRDRALDGARGNQLWYDGRTQTGRRLAFVRAVETRLALLGSYRPGDGRHYSRQLVVAIRSLQVKLRCSRPGKADWGTIGACTTAALDRRAAKVTRRWIAPK